MDLVPNFKSISPDYLYDHSGYDYIFLVEDDLAKEIITRLLRNNNLLASKLVHVLPCGGYTNVIDLAKEVVNSNLVGKHSKLSILLDGDVKSEAQQYVAKHGITNNIPINYLPVESLEKFLKNKLHDHVDHVFFRLLNDFIFHQVSLTEIIDSYRAEVDINKDKSGKRLYSRIDDELRNRNKSRADLVEIVVDFLVSKNSTELKHVTNFLSKQLSHKATA